MIQRGTNGPDGSGLPRLVRSCWVCGRARSVYTSMNKEAPTRNSRREGSSFITHGTISGPGPRKLLLYVVKDT